MAVLWEVRQGVGAAAGASRCGGQRMPLCIRSANASRADGKLAWRAACRRRRVRRAQHRMHAVQESSQTMALVLSPEEKEYYREIRGEYEALKDAAPSDFYELLGLEMNATQGQVKAAYRRLQRIVHPDIVGEGATALAVVLNSAYSTLGDANGRAVYDSAVKRFRSEVGHFTGQPVSTWEGPSHERRALFVDESTCIGCRNCNNCAGDTFSIEDEWGRARVLRQWADPEDLIQEAVEMCPVDCIYYVRRDQLALLEYVMKYCQRENPGLMGRRRSGNMASAKASENPFVKAEIFLRTRREAKVVEENTTRRVQDEQLAAAIAKAWLALPPSVRESGWPEWHNKVAQQLEVVPG